MKITELYRRNKLHPEEELRRQLLIWMVEKGGYPRELLAVEKELSQLPHLIGRQDLPQRRADLLCFSKDIHSLYPLFPLLLIECKAQQAGLEAKQQALGYNHYVQAPYVAVASRQGARLIFPVELPFLPYYKELLSKL